MEHGSFSILGVQSFESLDPVFEFLFGRISAFALSLMLFEMGFWLEEKRSSNVFFCCPLFIFAKTACVN